MFWIMFLYQSDIKELQYCSLEVRNRLSLVREINNTNVCALFLFDFPVCRIVPVLVLTAFIRQKISYLRTVLAY